MWKGVKLYTYGMGLFWMHASVKRFVFKSVVSVAGELNPLLFSLQGCQAEKGNCVPGLHWGRWQGNLGCPCEQEELIELGDPVIRWIELLSPKGPNYGVSVHLQGNFQCLQALSLSWTVQCCYSDCNEDVTSRLITFTDDMKPEGEEGQARSEMILAERPSRANLIRWNWVKDLWKALKS